MKKKFLNGILLMACVLSSVSFVVSCKDYDEDVYTDLKSRISKESTLREALQRQVDELTTLVGSLEKCECDLSLYLQKSEAERTYMKIADYEASIYQISANKAAVELINEAIKDIREKLATINVNQERVDSIAGKMGEMNDLISTVKANAEEALRLAKDGQCNCDFTEIEKRLSAIEGFIAGWDQQIADANSKADQALAKATRDSIMIVKQNHTIDSLITVLNNMQKMDVETIINRIEKLENTRYTKDEIDAIIRNIPTLSTEVVESILQRISTIENTYYTKQQIENLIRAINIPDLSDVLRRLAALEGKPAIDAYTKAEVDRLLQNLILPQTDLTAIERRLNELESHTFWTRQEIVDLINQYVTPHVDLTEVENRLTALENKPAIDAYTKAEVNALINNLNIPNITPIQQKLQQMEDTYLNSQQIISLIQQYAPQYDDNDIKQRLTTLENSMSNYYTKDNVYTKSEVNTLISNLNIPGLVSRIETLEGKDHYTKTEIINWIKENAPGYDDTDIKQRLTNAENALNNTYTKNDVYTKTEVNTIISGLNIPDIQPLKDRLDALEGKKFWTEQEIKDLIQQYAPAAYDDTEVRSLIQGLRTDVDNRYTKGQVDNLLDELRQQKNIIKQIADEALERAKNDSTWIKRDIEPKVGDLETNLNKVINEDLPQLKDDLTTVSGRVDGLTSRVEALEDDVEFLKDEINKLKQDEQNMITNIIVQAAQSPVIGYLNAPFDVRSTVLAVYYGKPVSDWEFPSTTPAHYVNTNKDFDLWTPRNIQVIGALTDVVGYCSGSAGETIVTEKDGSVYGNAGTVYVTVNPANVNFTGKELKLKNSQDEDAAITLSPLKRSDRVLTFGYTRSAENGFYEANATLPANKVDQAKLRIDFKAMEEDVKAMMKERSKSSVLNMGATLINNFQDVIPAYALQGSWTDATSNTVHNIYSQYNVAATAVSPLSFSFMNGYKIKKMPGLDRVQKMVGEMIDKIKIKVDLGLPDFAKYKGTVEFKTIEYVSGPTLADDLLRITYDRKFSISDFIKGTGDFYDAETGGTDQNEPAYIFVTNFNGQFAFAATNDYGATQLVIYDTSDPNNKHWRPATATEKESVGFGAISSSHQVEININKDFTPEMQSIINDVIATFNNGIITDVNKSFGPESDLAKTITNLLNDVAKLGDIDTKINKAIVDAKNDIKSQLNSYITKLNNRLTSYFNRIPGILHLTLIASTGEKAGLLSMTKSLPTKASGSLTLVPTSYNLELLAPAYKKFVAVTDVFDEYGNEIPVATAREMASAANGSNMGRVIDSEKICKMNAGQSGYIYEVTYTAIDYFGKVAIRKYYVQFK